MPGASQPLTIARVSDNLRTRLDDQVAVEEPLEIRLGFEQAGDRRTESVSITMRTPGHDAELATGFLFTEGIIRQREDVAFVKPCGPIAPDSGNHNAVRVELESGVAVDFDRLQRHFYTTSSCGVCGKASLEALRVQGMTAIPAGTLRFRQDMLIALPDTLRAAQETFDQTGGLHAAAAFDNAGKLIVCREDVGRHNAVDKVIGALFDQALLPASEYGLIVSGRASFELMQKTLLAGMPLLAAVGAPSSLAVQLAREFNVTLAGFLRGDTFNLYSAEERIS